MMTPKQIELARKLETHDKWTVEFDRSEVDIPSDGYRTWEGVSFACIRDENGHDDFVVDLTDDATAGVLLGMWREVVKANGDNWDKPSSRTYRGCSVGLMRAAFWNQEGETHMAELFALMLLDAWGDK